MKDRIGAAPGVLINEVGGESVILHLENQSCHLLDEVASRMWALLTTADSIQAAYDLLAKEYDADSDRLRADLLNLIADLAGRNLIEVHRA